MLELMIAIIIVVAVVSVSAPSMIRLYESMDYGGAVNKVVTLLSSARYKAIRQGSVEDVRIDPRSRQISVGDNSQELPDSLELKVLGARELNQDGVGVIRFYADGSSSGGVVVISGSGRDEVHVQVDWLLGSVKLCRNDCQLAL